MFYQFHLAHRKYKEETKKKIKKKKKKKNTTEKNIEKEKNYVQRKKIGDFKAI